MSASDGTASDGTARDGTARDGTARDRLDGQEPVGELFGTVFGLAEEIAGQISPAMLESRLRRTRRRAAPRPVPAGLVQAEHPPAETMARGDEQARPARRQVAAGISAAASGASGHGERPAAFAASGSAVPVIPVPEAAARPAAWAAAGWDSDRAVATLYAGHYKSLVRLATLLVRDIPTAEEVVQEAFIAVHGGRRRLRDQDKALAYLRQAVVNRSRSVLRHRLVMDRNAPRPTPDMPSAEHGAMTLLERSAVIAALRSLPPRQREALVLRYYGDLSEAQIAAAMGISKGAVKSHAARAMAALRSVLEREA